jgi:hypothetical protein
MDSLSQLSTIDFKPDIYWFSIRALLDELL